MPHGGGRDVFTLTNVGDVVEAQLGYLAHAVIVDNLTGNYVRVRGAGRDVPPWVWGAVIPVSGSQVADAVMLGQSPTPSAGPPTIGTGQATLTFTDEMLSPFSGHMLQQSTFSSPQPVPGGNPMSLLAGGNTLTISTPIGTTAIGVTVQSPAGLIVASCSLIGANTGIDYSALSGFATGKVWNAFQRFYRFPVDPLLDSSFTLNLQWAGGVANAFVDLYTSDSTMFVASNEIVQTTSNNSTPAPWQASNNDASLAETATGTFTLIAAPGVGHQLFIFGWSMGSDGTGPGGVRCHIIGHGLSNAMAWHSANNVGATAGFLGGRILPQNTGLDFVVDFLPGGDTALCAVTYNTF